MSKLKPIHSLKNLVIVLIILVFIDIFTGIWYFNREYELDSQKFNNIITPIASIITCFVVIRALHHSKKQNQINLGVSIRPFFTGRINAIRQKIQNDIANDTHLRKFLTDGENYKGFGWFKSINDALLAIDQDDEYKEDLHEIEKTNIIRDFHYFKQRSYFRVFHYLNGVAIGHHSFPFSEIKDLFIQIRGSDLLESDKEFLYLEIKYELLSEYISVISLDHFLVSPRIPFLYIGKEPKLLRISETEFGMLYDWIKKNINVIELK